MSKEILNLEPSSIWKNFYSLTQIPRPSKKEERIIQFMKEFGENLGLETLVDKVGNVIIKKPATPGFEDRKGVILQGHIDMVPQKNNDVDHDFAKDPIRAYIDGEWVTAEGTTLGADNGMGVAAAMSVLESNDIEHGPIEARVDTVPRSRRLWHGSAAHRAAVSVGGTQGQLANVSIRHDSCRRHRGRAARRGLDRVRGLAHRDRRVRYSQAGDSGGSGVGDAARRRDSERAGF